MRPIRGPRHAADDERTVEAPPEEPTMSAGIDVRAAFEAEDKTMPGAVVGLVPIEEASPAGDRTLPLVSPAIVREIQGSAKQASEPRQPAAAPPPPPSSQPRPRTAPIPFALPPPSNPVLMSAMTQSDADDEPPIDIPGVGGAQRKRMLRIVFGVLGVCALLCVVAVVQQLLSGNASGSSSSSSSSSKASTTASTATAATATETATPSASATPTATATASAVASAEPPPPSAPATATPEPPAAPPPPAPPPTAAVATPIARAPAADPPPPAPRPRQAAPPPPAPRPRQAAPPAAKPKPSIVRDAPF